ncbi:hypothetical protein MTBUT4_60174 [Magnetospirillum sp. UT-4]|nr:hypothetical protein MTBUT4_60174 [Magnetospirillum sp. UT-4]
MTLGRRTGYADLMSESHFNLLI